MNKYLEAFNSYASMKLEVMDAVITNYPDAERMTRLNTGCEIDSVVDFMYMTDLISRTIFLSLTDQTMEIRYGSRTRIEVEEDE